MPETNEAQTIYGSAVEEYRQALADTQWSLAQANGWLKVKDRRIAELTEQIAKLRAPKPGPR